MVSDQRNAIVGCVACASSVILPFVAYLALLKSQWGVEVSVLACLASLHLIRFVYGGLGRLNGPSTDADVVKPPRPLQICISVAFLACFLCGIEAILGVLLLLGKDSVCVGRWVSGILSVCAMLAWISILAIQNKKERRKSSDQPLME